MITEMALTSGVLIIQISWKVSKSGSRYRNQACDLWVTLRKFNSEFTPEKLQKTQ